MLIPKWELIWKCSRIMSLRSTHTRTSGGTSDTEVKELAVMPCAAPLASCTVTTVMPLANLPQMRRNCCFSIRERGGSGGWDIDVEFSTGDALNTSLPAKPLEPERAIVLVIPARRGGARQNVGIPT